MLDVVVVRPCSVGFEEPLLLSTLGARGAPAGPQDSAGSHKPLVSHYSANPGKHSFLAHAHNPLPPPLLVR